MTTIINKKGVMTIEEIGYWFLALIALGITIAIIILIRNVGHESIKIFPQSNASRDFLFTAEQINVTDDSPCTKISDKEYDNCKAHEDIAFETTIRNDGADLRRFWGGKTICKVQCNKRNVCTPIDKTACTNDVTSGKDLCSAKIGESSVCDAGSFSFDPGIYYIYPVATCYLNDQYGCSTTNSKTGTLMLTEAPKDYSTNFIKITVT